MACSRISSVQLFHLMPKDWADQKRNQLRTDLHELTQGGHFLLVYYNPIEQLYEAITSQSWSPVVKSKELSRVLHSATQPIAYDEKEVQWCQQECSSLDKVLKQHIARDDLKKCLTYLKWESVRKRTQKKGGGGVDAVKAWQKFKGTSAFFGEPQEGNRVAPSQARIGAKAPAERVPLLVNAREAWTQQTGDMPAHHVMFEDFLKRPIKQYTYNENLAALGLLLEYYDSNHFTNAEPSPALTTAYRDLAVACNMDCHQGALQDDDEEDTSETSRPEPKFSRKVWLALVNAVLFPYQTMKSSPFNVNSAARHFKNASFRGREGGDPLAVFVDDSGSGSRKKTGSSKPLNISAWCVQNTHLLLSPEEQQHVETLPGHRKIQAVAAAFSKLKQDATVEGSDAQKTLKALNQKFKEYQQSISSRAAAAHAPAAAGTLVCEGFPPPPLQSHL